MDSVSLNAAYRRPIPGWRARALLYAVGAGLGLAEVLPAIAQAPAANQPAPTAPDASKQPAQTPPPAATPPAAATPPGVQQLPPVVVTEPSTEVPKHAKKAARKATAGPSAVAKSVPGTKSTVTAASLSAGTPSTGTAASAGSPAAEGPTSPLAIKNDAFNEARKEIFTQVGTNSYSLGEDEIQALPQGTETLLSKALLQAPGVTHDSAASGQIHVRNEHANLQYRINGILLPDGVSGFSDVLETSFIGRLSLVTGALPAEYGLHTSGLIDITTRAGAQEPGGTISSHGGSRGTFTQSLDYGGSSGPIDYFFTGRYLTNDEGIENPTPSWDAIHDHTDLGRGFGYVSALLDDSTRLSWISGVSVQNFQIPNTPGLSPAFTTITGLPSYFDSSMLNEHQFEQNYYDVIALQRKIENGDYQIAYFSRYSDLHFHPDDVGDLIFNGIASDVQRRSFLNGIQGDGSYRLNAFNTLRAGFSVSGEQTKAISDSSVVEDDLTGLKAVSDETSKLGWLIGIYAQDEIRLTNQLTLNVGLRFDQMYEYVDANQWSPRVSLEYRPYEGTTLHAGYARYFTPPPQVASGPTNVAAFDGTVQQSETCGGNVAGVNDTVCGLVQPERSHYFDAGITQRVFPGLDVGVDAYYKIARDLLDDGQFGAALVLDAFNYETGINRGIEFKANYKWANFSTYGNVAIADQKGKNIVSNQYLFSQDDLDYIGNHFIYTDHTQFITVSAGVSYLWEGTRFSADLIYGSGLRTDLDTVTGTIPNGASVPAYTQVNLGVSHEFANWFAKPTTVRFDVVNLFDQVYQIRNGSGVGVFAPQYGPRLGFFVGLSQKF